MRNINRTKGKALLFLIILIVLGICIYKVFLAINNNQRVSEKQAYEILSIPIITIDDEYLGQKNKRFEILDTASKESYGYYVARNLNDFDEVGIFVQLYGVKGKYEFPLPSKYKEYIIKSTGNFEINDIVVSWKSLYVGENKEYELMYNIDLDKSKYLLIVSLEDITKVDKINDYIMKKLKNNRELKREKS